MTARAERVVAPEAGPFHTRRPPPAYDAPQKVPSPLRRPVRTAVVIVAGVLVGLAGYVVVDVIGTFEKVASEPFDPAAAEGRIASATVTTRPPVTAAFVEDPLERELQARAREAAAAARARAIGVVPEATGVPLPDEMFTSVLLVGVDASGALADVLIAVLLPADGSTPLMVSLPRDLYVPNPCKGTFTKINQSLGGCRGVASGSENLALAVEGFTGVKVDHFARVGFDGFADVVDRLGGVTVCVGDLPVRDLKSGLDLPAGCHDADGYTALAWVRSRTPEYLVDGAWVTRGGSDFDRQRKQQDVLFQFARMLSSYSSVGSLAGALDAVASAVRMDSGWSVTEAASLGFRYRSLDPADVVSLSIRTRNVRTSRGEAALVPTVRFTDVLAAAYPPAARR